MFLQGAILVDSSNLPDFFTPEINVFQSFEKECIKNRVSKLEVCLDYIKTIKWKDGVVTGIQSEIHLEEILVELSKPITIRSFSNQVLSSSLVDPRKWNLNL
jgi:hypothetical protein